MSKTKKAVPMRRRTKPGEHFDPMVMTHNPNRFQVCSFECEGWRPRHVLDLPGPCVPGAFTCELTYNDEPMFCTREHCIRVMAEENREHLEDEGADLIVYTVVIEYLNPVKWWAVYSAERPAWSGGAVAGATGYVTIHDAPFRIVQPTAEEIAKYVKA